MKFICSTSWTYYEIGIKVEGIMVIKKDKAIGIITVGD